MEIGGGLTGVIAKSVQFAFERFRRGSPLETLVRPAAVMRAYFPVAPDEKEATRKLKQSPHLDHLAWEKAVFEDYGGVLQLGPVIVSIANRTRVPVTIVDIRSRVLTQ